jgi:prefoldin subunit 5
MKDIEYLKYINTLPEYNEYYILQSRKNKIIDKQKQKKKDILVESNKQQKIQYRLEIKHSIESIKNNERDLSNSLTLMRISQNIIKTDLFLMSSQIFDITSTMSNDRVNHYKSLIYVFDNIKVVQDTLIKNLTDYAEQNKKELDVLSNTISKVNKNLNDVGKLVISFGKNIEKIMDRNLRDVEKMLEKWQRTELSKTIDDMNKNILECRTQIGVIIRQFNELNQRSRHQYVNLSTGRLI